MPLSVLIVDDSKAMRMVVRKTLSAAGFDVSEIYEGSDGLEALEILNKHQVDVVLSDLHMPNMNGMELLATLNKEGRVPGLFYSGHHRGTQGKVEGSAHPGRPRFCNQTLPSLKDCGKS